MKRAAEKFYSTIKAIDGVLGIIAGFCILVITIIICYEIIARYLFHRPPIWAFDICSYLLLVVALFSGAYAMAENGHVSFTMVLERLKPKARRVAMIIGFILGLTYCFFLLSQSVRLGAMAINRNMYTHDQLSIPDIYLYLVIIVGALFLSVTFLVKAIIEVFDVEKTDFTSKEY